MSFQRGYQFAVLRGENRDLAVLGDPYADSPDLRELLLSPWGDVEWPKIPNNWREVTPAEHRKKVTRQYFRGYSVRSLSKAERLERHAAKMRARFSRRKGNKTKRYKNVPIAA